MTMTTTGIILLVAYVAFVVGSLGYAAGFVSGKPRRYYRTQYSKWVTEKTFVKQYQKIREKFQV